MLPKLVVSFIVPQCFPDFQQQSLDDIAAACSSVASSLSVMLSLPLQLQQHPLSFLMQGPPKPHQLDPSCGTMAAASPL